jgi:hypothetical protein
VCAALGGTTVQTRADDPPDEGNPPPAMKADHPLPQHFDQLDLTEEQQEKIFAIMDEVDERITHHQNEIRRLRGKLYTTSIIIAHANAIKKLRIVCQQEVEKVLDDDQRAKLKELRSDM